MPPANRAAKASMLNGGAGVTMKCKQVAARKLKLGMLKSEVGQTVTSPRHLDILNDNISAQFPPDDGHKFRSIRPSGEPKPAALIPDIPIWATVPDVTAPPSPLTKSEVNGPRYESAPPLEMKLISELYSGLIPDFDPLPSWSTPPKPVDGLSPYGDNNRSPPSRASAHLAIMSLDLILRPPRTTGNGYKQPKLNTNLKTRLQDMQSVLRLFCKDAGWMDASETIAVAKGRGPYYGRTLRHWIKSFITDGNSLPTNAWGSGNVSRLDTDDGLRDELRAHLQDRGKYVRAQDLVDYLDRDEVKARYHATVSISLKTAQRWMEDLGYNWTDSPTGQYVDGHERVDVVDYRQNIFLPAWFAKEPRLRVWLEGTKDEPGNMHQPTHTSPLNRRTVVWYHDESVFYAHDRRERRWVPVTENAVPRPKGEGHSLMVADFVSADYGWLRSPDGKESARVLLRPGARRDGYFTNDDIVEQATKAMDVLKKYYPNDDHVLVYDNATTHLKRSRDSISARRMPMKTSKPEKNWLVPTPSLDESGDQIFNSKGGKVMKLIEMAPGRFDDGTPQSFYFPKGHRHAGLFKGMRVILEERGFPASQLNKLKWECKNFHCRAGRTNCCMRRVLYSQPDFQNVKSVLEDHCDRRGIEVLFLPKFHPELNPIEQCWGRAKWYYRRLPASSLEEDLERNVVESLESIPITLMRR